jgi:glycosyltransferase involved in cell wall biosynthesis
VGVSFIHLALSRADFDFFFIVSPEILAQLPDATRNRLNLKVAKHSPARPLTGAVTRMEIKAIEREFSPDVVYSLGFPSYVMFSTPEIGRYTNPWEMNLPPIPWHLLGNPYKRIKTHLEIFYKQAWAKRADWFETQTEAGRLGIINRLGVDADRVYVVGNSLNAAFGSQNGSDTKPAASTRDALPIVLCLAADHLHKNLEIIPNVCKDINHRQGVRCRFLLTLPLTSNRWLRIARDSKRLGVEDLVQNLGELTLAQCVDAYRVASVVFLPTLLEVFSATYIEAMQMMRPVITPDLPFARDVCHDAALYFDPKSTSSAAECIALALVDKQVYLNLVAQGKTLIAEKFSLTKRESILFANLTRICKNATSAKYQL